MAEQAIVATEKNSPHGLMDPVPHRETGKEDKGLLSPTQDKNTESRRAHYGEDPAFNMPQGERIMPPMERVNDMQTPNNPTRDERIRDSNSDSNPKTGFGRHMCA